MDGFDTDFFASSAAAMAATGGDGTTSIAPTANPGDSGFAGFDMGDFDFGAPASTTAAPTGADAVHASAPRKAEVSIPAHMGDSHGPADPWATDLAFPQPASASAFDLVAETVATDDSGAKKEEAPSTKLPASESPAFAAASAPTPSAAAKGAHVSFAVPTVATESQASSVHPAPTASAAPSVAGRPLAAHIATSRAHQQPPYQPHHPQQRAGTTVHAGPGLAKPMPEPDVKKAMRNMEEALRMTAGAADPSPNEAADFDDDVAAIEAGFAKLSDDVTDSATMAVAAVVDQAAAMGPCELGTFLGHPKASFPHLLPLIIAELRAIQ